MDRDRAALLAGGALVTGGVLYLLSRPSAPKCPAHAHLSGGKCLCDTGYVAQGNLCVAPTPPPPGPAPPPPSPTPATCQNSAFVAGASLGFAFRAVVNTRPDGCPTYQCNPWRTAPNGPAVGFVSRPGDLVNFDYAGNDGVTWWGRNTPSGWWTVLSNNQYVLPGTPLGDQSDQMYRALNQKWNCCRYTSDFCGTP